MSNSKTCRVCDVLCLASEFRAGKNQCRDCENSIKRQRRAEAKQVADRDPIDWTPPEGPSHEDLDRAAQAAHERIAAQRARMESDTEHLRPEDFDVGALNDGQHDPRASREKRQEYSRRMGTLSQSLAMGELTKEDGQFVAGLSEQERRFRNRSQLARPVAIGLAAEMLNLRLFKQAAEQFLSDKIVPTGYAARPKNHKIKRTVVLLLSDLHLGASLSDLDNPIPFGAIQEARRLEFVVRQAIDFKPQYRENTELLVLLNGDIIEGNLGHDLRDGSPLTEQKVVFWRAFRDIMGAFAAAFPRVRVECQPGNHGRDKLRHPGRATSSKWDGHEWQMYFALGQMCSGLKNVTFNVPFRAVSLIDLHGSKLLLTHGDTEFPLRHPDTGAAHNFAAIDRANTTRLFGDTFDVAAFGHFHTARYQPRNPRVIWNGALVPPNGHARTSGYVGEPCGQWLWEAVEGHPVGDLRFAGVDSRTDDDERLGTIVKPFRFPNT